MAMRELITSLGMRLPVMLQHSISASHLPAGAAAAASVFTGQRRLHAGRLSNPWEEVLRVAKSNPEKLHEIVGALTTHCIKAQAAPPLEHYNELLRICEMHADLASVHKLCQMACAVRMHLDHTTFERLQSAYSYFPKPYANHLAKGSFTGKDGLGPSTAQHTGSSSSSSDGMAAAGAVNTSGSSSSSVRAGAILEAPAASSVPSISATGGASSVSVGSMSAVIGRQGAKVTHTTQTNVWLPLRDTSSSSSRLQAAQTQQGGVERSSGGGDASTVNAPDAAA